MISFIAEILKFGKMGEKTGWTYIELNSTQAHLLNPGVKTVYRIKGQMDGIIYKSIALAPMGEGSYIMPLNAALRKKLNKKEGESISITMEVDMDPVLIDLDFMDCLNEDEPALNYFKNLSNSHQLYFSKWIASAKTIDTKAKRILRAVRALHRKMNYAEMIREKDF